MKFGRDRKVELKKSFRALLPNFIEGPYKSWLKFHPLGMDESEPKEAKG